MAPQLEKQHGQADQEISTGTYKNPEFKEKSYRVIYAAIGATILAGLVVVFAKPVYVYFRTERGLRLARESEALLVRGMVQQSGRHIQAALKLASMEPAVWRATAHYCATNHMRDGLNYYDMLLASPAVTHGDRLGYVSLALDLNLTDLAGPVLEKMSRTNSPDVEALRLQVRYFNLIGRPAQAIATARLWLKIQPDSAEAQFALGFRLLYQNDVRERADGRKILLTQALGNGSMRFRAVELLAANNELTRREGELLIRSLLDRPKATFEERLAAASIRIKIDPLRRARYVQEFVRNLAGDVSDDELAALVNWLIFHEDVVRALELLPAERARDKPQLLAAWLRAKGIAGQWTEVSNMLERDEKAKVLEPYLFHLYNAGMLISKGRTENNSGRNFILGHFESALAACADRIGPMLFVAEYAERLGQNRAAISAHIRLMDYPPLTVSSGKAILRLVEPLDDIKLQRQILRRLVSFVASEQKFQLQNAYLACLSNSEVTDSKAFLDEYLKTNPKDSYARGIAALALLRLNQPEAALEMIDTAGMNWATVLPHWKAIRAAILGANNDRVGARTLARQVENAPMRAECGAADSSVELESDLNVEEREGFSGSERDWIASCVGRLFRNRCGK